MRTLFLWVTPHNIDIKPKYDIIGKFNSVIKECSDFSVYAPNIHPHNFSDIHPRNATLYTQEILYTV